MDLPTSTDQPSGIALDELQPPSRLPFNAPLVKRGAAESRLPGDTFIEWCRVGPAEDVAARPIEARSKPSTSRSAKVPIRRGEVCEYPLGDELLLFDPRSQTVYYFNAIASVIWRGCDGNSLSQLAENMAKKYRVSFDTSLRHVTELVDLFATGGLLIEESTNAG